MSKVEIEEEGRRSSFCPPLIRKSINMKVASSKDTNNNTSRMPLVAAREASDSRAGGSKAGMSPTVKRP